MDISQNFRSPKSRISSITISPAKFFFAKFSDSEKFRSTKIFGVRKFLNFSGFWDFGLRKFSYSENFLRKNFGLHGFSKIWAMLSRKNFPMDTKNCQKCSSLGIKWDTKKTRGALFCYGAPRRGADGGHFFKKPQPAQGVPGGIPLVVTILREKWE